MPTAMDEVTVAVLAQAGGMDDWSLWSWLFVAAAFLTVVLVARLARSSGRGGPPLAP